MLKYVCICCVWFVLISLWHCGKIAWHWLVAAYHPC